MGTLEIDLFDVMNSAQLSATSYREQFEELLGEAYVSIQREDSKAKHSKGFHQRHRLAVLLDILRRWEAGVRQRSPILPVAAVSEIAATLKMFEKGRHDDLWPNLVRSLTNPTNYAHTVILLSLALYLRDVGAEVSLQSESNRERRCDLVVDYGQAGSLNLEVKAPRDLQWQVDALLPKRAMDHVKKQFSTAGTTSKGQLPPPMPGVLAIGVLAADSRTLDLLKASAEKHLLYPPGDYSHIMGVLFVSLGSYMSVPTATITGNRIQMDARVNTATHIDLVPNPHYRGAIRWRMSG